MIQYLITKKVKDEAMKKTKKALLYSGVVLTGIGAIYTCKAIKKMKEAQQQEDNEFGLYELKLQEGCTDEHYKHNHAHDINGGCGCHHENHEHKDHNQESCSCKQSNEIIISGFKEKEPEKDELEKKIDEFNSRRITDENTPDASTDEMLSKLNKVENTKDEVTINEGDYQKEKFEEYEYYEDALKKEEQ